MRDYIVTYTGKKFYPMNPHPDQIDIRDIARGLSQICRFSGQVPAPYSVAQHSVLVADILIAPPISDLAHCSLDTIRAGLLHDASEAYIGDVPTPLKKDLPLYNEVETNIIQCVYEKFGIPFKDLPEEVKVADAIALKTEFRDLVKHGGEGLPVIPPPVFHNIVALHTAEEARAYFLNKFVELFYEK
jgi:5'-deoxynucleotidase YfbR-like HD superfamily hydrolase